MELEYTLMSEATARRIYREHVAVHYRNGLGNEMVSIGKVTATTYNKTKGLFLIRLDSMSDGLLFGGRAEDVLQSIDLIDQYYDGTTLETLEDIEAEPELPETKVEPFELRDADGKTVLGQSHITINLTVDDKLSEQWTEQKVGEMVSNRLFWKLMNTDKQE